MIKAFENDADDVVEYVKKNHIEPGEYIKSMHLKATCDFGNTIDNDLMLCIVTIIWKVEIIGHANNPVCKELFIEAVNIADNKKQYHTREKVISFR